MNTYIAGILLYTLFTLATIVICDPQGEFQQLFASCKQETGVSDADMKKFMEGGQNQADASQPLKCFVKCIMEKKGDFKAGVFNADGVLAKLKEVPALKQRIPEIEKTIAKCRNEKGANECDTAFKVNMCLRP